MTKKRKKKKGNGKKKETKREPDKERGKRERNGKENVWKMNSWGQKSMSSAPSLQLPAYRKCTVITKPETPLHHSPRESRFWTPQELWHIHQKSHTNRKNYTVSSGRRASEIRRLILQISSVVSSASSSSAFSFSFSFPANRLSTSVLSNHASCQGNQKKRYKQCSLLESRKIFLRRE